MEGNFHEAAVMGHDILGLSASLDSVANLLELGACNESIYSSSLGIDDVHHHDGSVIDYNIIDSGRSGLEVDLGVAHIPLDGLIPLVATHQLSTPLNSFGNARVKITTRDFVHLDSKDTTSIDASGNISSLLNDPIVSTSLSTTQLASLSNVRTASSDCVGKGDTSLNSEGATSFDASGNISSLLNDVIVSTSLSTTQPASLNKVKTPSTGHVGKGHASLCSEGSMSIKASSNSSISLDDTINSTSLRTTRQLATLKKVRAASRKSLETGVALEQLKTHGHTRHLIHTHASKATSKRKKRPSKSETASSRTSGLKGTRSPEQKDSKHFRCSMCGAVYKSHELCVNHVLNRHKPGMSIKHNLSRSLSKNTQNIQLEQDARNLKLHANSSNHEISQDSVKLKSKSAIDSKTKTTESQQSPKVDVTAQKDLSRLTVTVRRAIKNVISQNDPATNSIFGKNLEANIDCESIPSHCKRTLLILKSKSAIGSESKRTRHPQSIKMNTSIQKDSSRSKVTMNRAMKNIDSSDATKSKFGENLKTNITCKSSPAHCQIASVKLKSKSPIYSKTKRTESPQNPKVTIITQNKIGEDSSRLKAMVNRAERNVDYQNDLARKSNFIENQGSNIGSKSSLASCQTTSTKLKSKSAISSKTKSPRGTKVNTSTLAKNSDTALIDVSTFIPEDIGRQEMEDEPSWSDMSPVRKPKKSSTDSASNRRCVALKGSKKLKRSSKRGAKHCKEGARKRTKEDSGSAGRCVTLTEKRDYGDRTKERTNLERSSKRDAKHLKEGARKKIKEDGRSAERAVRLLDPRQLTIVICPKCQKAFTTYTGYSHHTTQVHNVSANDSPGTLRQLLVQRSPRYSSKNTALPSLDKPQESKCYGNDGVFQQRVELGVCSSSDSLTVEEHRSDQVQLALKTAETSISDSSRTIGKDSSEERLSARATKTGNQALDEPLFNQENENNVTLSGSVLNEQIAFEASYRTPHEDEMKVNEGSNAARNLAVESATCSVLVDLSIQESSKTSKKGQGGSILCSSCGVVFEDSSDLDDDHQLGSVPGELVCQWTAPEETTAGSSYLCTVCGISITLHPYPNSHSCEADMSEGVPT